MRLSDGVLKALAKKVLMYITGDKLDIVNDKNPLVEPKVIHKIMNFFLDMRDEKHLDLPLTETAISYTTEMMRQCNGTDAIKKIIEKLLTPAININTDMAAIFSANGQYTVTNKTSFAVKLGPYLEKDGYKLVAVRKIVKGANEPSFHYRVLDEKEFAETPAMEENKEAQGIITTAKERFAKDDYKGAISSSFHLAETVIKKLLDELDISYKGKSQFVDCYPLLAKELNLNPAGENIEGRLKPILQGLKSQAEGLYHLANKASDRHTPEHPPKRQDAKLAMNAAFTLCEYLSDTHKSRQAQ